MKIVQGDCGSQWSDRIHAPVYWANWHEFDGTIEGAVQCTSDQSSAPRGGCGRSRPALVAYPVPGGMEVDGRGVLLSGEFPKQDGPVVILVTGTYATFGPSPLPDGGVAIDRMFTLAGDTIAPLPGERRSTGLGVGDGYLRLRPDVAFIAR